MSRSSISSGDGISMPNRLRNLVQAQKPDIKINLARSQKTYTTLDKIEGTVTITAPIDTYFDAVDIEFVGTSRTYVERLTTAAAASGRSEAFHQFLKLSQPGLQQHYPESGMLKAGQAYDFPFVFVVPQQLLPRICQHKVHNPAVRDAHLQLPPTLGDKDLASHPDALDDFAPDMASVRYGVFAKVSKVKVHDNDVSRVSLASKARKLRIMPATDEQPPLDVGGEDSEYIMRKEKGLRKGMLKGKLGTLTMEAAQPQSLRLRSYTNPEFRTTTMATVMLRFDPAEENSPPPRLGSLSSKLKVCTFFASVARKNFPSKHASLLDLSQGMHSEEIKLSSRCMANVEWAKCDPAKPVTNERRDSATSCTAGETPDPSSTYKGNVYYTARLLVPVTLPTNKSFVPTFHGCLISRVYQIKLELGVQSAGIAPTLDLKLPIQISSEGSSDDQNSRRDSAEEADEAEIDAEDASDFFQPRTLRAPSEGFVGRSRIGSQAPIGDAPPGYSPFIPATHPRHMSVVPVY
ncbi:hypothetical protein LTR36_006131 [Oleoguttula mirabilis]|uniref:Arrestin-like N-terminal domain-containing protein n=1 Tax=Oleoguttula mirabilis TaxID=1507867 RepID=A0AAV9JCD8_9PEZI|nr:hypothetical protein LTR36_006131 [Oleoguttula mirabilis]